MPVVSSTFTLEGAQADGTKWCQESHVCGSGQVVGYYYLASVGTDCAAVMAQRVATVNTGLADIEEQSNYDRDGAPTLVELTAAQFAARLRERYRAATNADCCKMAYWLLRRITAGDVTDAQCRTAFGVTSTQWTNFKTNTLTPQSNAWAAILAATGS